MTKKQYKDSTRMCEYSLIGMIIVIIIQLIIQ